MSPKSQPLLSKAIDLPPIERAELVEHLLHSFELPYRKKIDALWAREAEERLDAYQRGKIKAVTADKVFKIPRVRAAAGRIDSRTASCINANVL